MKKRMYIVNKMIFIVHIMLFTILKLRFVQKQKNTLLLVRLDKIGDYILFRNFIEVIAKSDKYKGYDIFLCGNISWKELSEKLDSKYINKFIWINRIQFRNSFYYKWEKMKEVNSLGCEMAIESTYSREYLYGDSIIAASNATKRIGTSGELIPKIMLKRKIVYNKLFTNIIQANPRNKFEFFRNKEFFEQILNEPITLTKTSLITDSFSSTYNFQEKYVLMAPGAGEEKRIWSPENFSKLINFITDQKSLNIILVGSHSELKITRIILTKIKNKKKVIDVTGKTSLIDLVLLIKNASLVITHDTGTLHISGAFNKKTVCLSNGMHYNRFVPYPKNLFSEGIFIFPNAITEEYAEQYRFNSDFEIDRITFSQVIQVFDKLINQLDIK
ncbi:MAG: hypothetical protein O6940_13475 [Ignavibacteria bacterium]|nr:hypothetical protein [Ignavibacteria bacterium]